MVTVTLSKQRTVTELTDIAYGQAFARINSLNPLNGAVRWVLFLSARYRGGSAEKVNNWPTLTRLLAAPGIVNMGSLIWAACP